MSFVQDFLSQFQHRATGYVSAALAVTGLAFLTKSGLGLLTAFLRIFILSGQSVRSPSSLKLSTEILQIIPFLCHKL